MSFVTNFFDRLLGPSEPPPGYTIRRYKWCEYGWVQPSGDRGRDTRWTRRGACQDAVRNQAFVGSATGAFDRAMERDDDA